MSLKSAPYYWVVCDGCDDRIDYGDFSALDSAGSAEQSAQDSEWRVHDDKHYCPECPAPWCSECDQMFTDERPRDPDDTYLCVECTAPVPLDGAR